MSGTKRLETGWKTRSKDSSAKAREVAHVALLGGDGEAVAFGDHAVLRELSGRVVEDGDVGAGGGEDGALLAAA